MNRTHRRAFRAALKRMEKNAPLYVATMVDQRSGRGDAFPPAAFAAMTRALRKCLKSGGSPALLKLNADEAEGFPNPRPHTDGWQTWLAVGIDREGRGTYVTRAFKFNGAAPNLELLEARTVMLDCLQSALAQPFRYGGKVSLRS